MVNPKAHVLVLAFPGQGHINPMLQFTKFLISRGIKATFATTPYTLPSIHAPGIDVFPISDGFDTAGPKEAPDIKTYFESFKAVGSRTVTELIHELNASSALPVTCLVYNSLLTWGLEVARSLGIYAATFLTVSASVCTIFRMVDCGRLQYPFEPEDFPVMVQGIPPLGSDDMPRFLVEPPSPYLKAVLDIFAYMDENDFVFTNSFDMLENEVAKAMHGQWPLQMIGPLVPSLDSQSQAETGYGSSLWQLPEGDMPCNEWLNTMPPKSVVYISFGSMAKISTVQLEQIAHGLIATQANFLWVVREAENRELLNDLLQNNPNGHQARLIVAWCNQIEVLLNEAIGCFVTHCGWNSTLEAISLGVPVVAMPQWSDQPMNAKCIEDVWKVGVRAKRNGEGIVEMEEIKRCVEEVTCGEKSEEFRKNALKWRDLAKDAMSPGGSSYQKIEEFVQILVKT